MSIGCFGKSLACNTEYKDAWGHVRTKKYHDEYRESLRRGRGEKDYLPGKVYEYSQEEIEAYSREHQETWK